MAALRVEPLFAVCLQAGRTMAVNSGLKTLLAGIMRDVAALQPTEATGAMSAVAEAAVAGFQVRSALQWPHLSTRPLIGAPVLPLVLGHTAARSHAVSVPPAS